jgi:hypothetical membrane protein
MFDRVFSAVLAFVVLAAGTVAIGSEMLGMNDHARSGRIAAVIELPTVQITGQRTRDIAQQEATEPARSSLQ